MKKIALTTFALALAVGGLMVGSEVRIVTGLLLFCIATWLSVRMYRSSRARQVLEQA